MNRTDIARLLNTRDLLIVPTDLGLSNENLLITADGTDYIWRRPLPGSDSLDTSHRAAQQAMELAASLDVPTLYYDPETGEKITRRVQAETFGESSRPDRFRQAGLLLKQLHALEPIDAVFDPFQKLETYRARTRSPLRFDHEEEILACTRRLWTPACLCHNDLVPGNILLGDKRSWLIDYEYATTGDPRFDMASFLSENAILDPDSRQQFLEACDPGVPSWQVMIFELVADMIWANWAQMLHEQRQDPVFADIRRDKQKHFAKILNKLMDIRN